MRWSVLLAIMVLAQACQKAEPIRWETTLDASLARAKAEHRPALIDFTASWCAACQELEKRTYVDPAVQKAAARYVCIKVDASVLNDAMQAVFNRYNIVGLPAVLFVDAQGTLRDTPRVSGFVEAPRFADMLGRVQ